MTLYEADENKILTVVSLKEARKGDFLKLTSMGILPGTTLTITQKKPLIVFQIGFSKFAIDKELAGIVNVK